MGNGKTVGMRVTSSLQPIVRIVFEETGILQPPAFPKVEPGRATDAVVLSGPRDIRKEFGYDEPVRCLFQMLPESTTASVALPGSTVGKAGG